MDEAKKTDPRRSIGARGEAIVREHVIRLGWRLVDHNVRWREGELDLIAIDGRTLVIGEVKTLMARSEHGSTSFSPFESINARKQVQIRMLAKRWIVDDIRRGAYAQPTPFNSLRFDAFAVTLARSGELLELEHLEDAF